MNRALDRDRRSSSQVWLDVVSAVDYLSRGHRPGLTVYDALEEALRWHAVWPTDGYDDASSAPEPCELPWDDPDPLRTALEQLIADNPPTIDQESTTGDALHHALRVWTGRMADQFNDDQQWAHPNATQRGAGAAIWPLDCQRPASVDGQANLPAGVHLDFPADGHLNAEGGLSVHQPDRGIPALPDSAGVQPHGSTVFDL